MRLTELIFISLLSIQLVLWVKRIFLTTSMKVFSFLLLLLVLIFHIIFEGLRWQMIPIYSGFVILMLFMFFTKKSSKRFINYLKISLVAILFILGIFLSTALPVLEFKPNGPHRVSISDFNLIDNNRREIFIKDSADYRNISVRLFYPTGYDQKKKVAYFPDWEGIRPTFDKKLGWPDCMLKYLSLFNLEASKGQDIKSGKFPLIIYSHGLANNYTEASGRLLNLASHGFVVAAINHTYSSDYARLYNGETVGYVHPSFLGKPIEQTDSLKSIIANQWVDDAKFTINKIRGIDISNSIDFENIGLMGFSAGGTMALLGATEIKNVKAAINLDGTPRAIKNYDDYKTPVLMLYSEVQTFSDAQIKAWGITREEFEAPQKLIENRSQIILESAPKGSKMMRIEGTRHSNFVEYPLISPFSNYLEIGGEINSWECYRLINNEILEFLSLHLEANKLKYYNYSSTNIF